MDQRIWSDQEVIKLSSKFVCARLSTYEDHAEGELLKKHFRGRSGDLENTVFVILASDGKTRLSNSGRSPQMVFGGKSGWESTILALEMHSISQKYPGKKNPKGLPPLPVSKDLRRSLNVAACDRQLLVLVDRVPENTMNVLQKLAWKDPFVGRFGWGFTNDPNELKAIGLTAGKPAVYVCKPGEFGLKATLLAKLPSNATTAQLESALLESLKSPREPEKNYRRHINKGKRLNKSWETEIEVTDPLVPPKKS